MNTTHRSEHIFLPPTLDSRQPSGLHSKVPSASHCIAPPGFPPPAQPGDCYHMALLTRTISHPDSHGHPRSHQADL